MMTFLKVTNKKYLQINVKGGRKVFINEHLAWLRISITEKRRKRRKYCKQIAALRWHFKSAPLVSYIEDYFRPGWYQPTPPDCPGWGWASPPSGSRQRACTCRCAPARPGYRRPALRPRPTWRHRPPSQPPPLLGGHQGQDATTNGCKSRQRIRIRKAMDPDPQGDGSASARRRIRIRRRWIRKATDPQGDGSARRRIRKATDPQGDGSARRRIRKATDPQGNGSASTRRRIRIRRWRIQKATDPDQKSRRIRNRKATDPDPQGDGSASARRRIRISTAYASEFSSRPVDPNL